MRFPRYVPESPELLADREAEYWSAHLFSAGYKDLHKDDCDEVSIGIHEAGPNCRRVGVPEAYSHLYDAQKVAA